MSVSELLQSLPEAHRKHLDPASPAPARMMAAKGLVPLPPREMVIVLVGLTQDADPNLGVAARSTLEALPDRVLGPALDGGLPSQALGAVVDLFAQAQGAPREAILEKLVLNRDTPDAALARLAPVAPASIVEIIAGNQERCLRSRELVEGLRNNPHLLKSSKDRVFDFLVRAGVLYEGMPEVVDAMARLSPAEMQSAVAHIELPQEAQVLLADSADDEARAKQAEEALDSDQREEEKVRRVPVLKLIADMTVAQKIALATKGNKEARTILVRDANRLVAAAAIRNPRITENEVVAAASSRSVSDEVIRVIARSKELTRTYAVKRALVYNPKTPVPTAMSFLSLLRGSDLRDVAKSRNVQTAVSTQAKRLLARKK